MDRKKYTECHDLLTRFKFKDLITTNWDYLLEDAFRNVGMTPNPISRLENWTIRAGKNEVSIIHIHGDAATPETITLTEKQYLGPNPLLDKALGIIERSTLLMLGLSLADRNILGLRASENIRNAFAILLDADAGTIDVLKNTYRITVINILTRPRERKTQALAHALRILQEEVQEQMETNRAATETIHHREGEFEQVLKEILHSTNVHSKNLVVMNKMDFFHYSIFFTDLIDKLQHYENIKLQIYNIYQPHDFLMDLLDGSKDLFKRLIPERKFNSIFKDEVEGSRKEHRYRQSGLIFEHILNDDGSFINDAVKALIEERCRQAFPSLNIINTFAERSGGRFRRITILFKEYETMLSKQHLQFFNLIMKTQESHFIVEDDSYRQIRKGPVHISDFCVWSGDALDVVSDYYPTSNTLIIGWHYKPEGESDAVVKNFVDYYVNLYRDMWIFNGQLIEDYISRFQPPNSGPVVA
jgi:3-dehydroquinate dehydratase